MNKKLKAGFVFDIRKQSNMPYIRVDELLVGYEYEDGTFCADDRQFKTMPTIGYIPEGQFVGCVELSSIIKDTITGKDIESMLDKHLMNVAFEYFRVVVDGKTGLNTLVKVEDEKSILMCDALFYDEINEKKSSKKNKNEKTNKETYDELIHTIIGQDKVVRGVYAHLLANKKVVNSNLSTDEIKKMKNNIFINGPTGSGKTFIVEEIAKRLDIPMIKVDANDYSMTGFVGQDVNMIISDLLDLCDGDLKEAEKGIVYIDEIDKIASTDDRDKVTTKGVQAALLTLMEGKDVKIEKKGMGGNRSIFFDTSKLTFVVSGACSGLEDIVEKRVKPTTIGFGNIVEEKEIEEVRCEPKDLIKYGFMPEFIGRLPVVYQINELSINDLKRILTDSLKSPYLFQQRKFELLGSKLELSDEEITKIAEKAYTLKTGARGIKNIINELCDELLAEAVICDNNQDENEKPKVMFLS